MKSLAKSRQAGFTLVEIAIVLVIIGLLLGGVLKGQELIENSKIKGIAADMKSLQAAYNGYYDRYKAFPGTETAATMNGRGWLGTAGIAAAVPALNITLAQTFAGGAAATQVGGFWRAMRGSGLLQGDPTQVLVAAIPKNSAGGLLGVTTGAAGQVFGQTGTFVCASGLSTKQAAGLDSLIDGTGATNDTGTLLAVQNAANPFNPTVGVAATPYNETVAGTWTACFKIG